MKFLATVTPLLELVDQKDIPGGVGYVFRAPEGELVLASSSILDDKLEGKRKWKIKVSIGSGCDVGCIYCFTLNLKQYRALSADEIVYQVDFIRNHFNPGIVDEIKVEFKEMGDPSTNSRSLCQAINALNEKYPNFLFVVSSVGVRNFKAFEQLKAVRANGALIRLQFSCHTTDDQERFKLSPKLKMLSLSEIAEIVESWYDGSSLVTLTFVPFKGFDYSASKLRTLFDPKKVFIKISYVDLTRAAKAAGLLDESPEKVRKFIAQLESLGFQVGRRVR